MKKVSLRMDDKTYRQTVGMAKTTMLSIDQYVNIALKHFNKMNAGKLLAEQFKSESKIVSKDSILVLSEFEEISD